MSRKLSMLHIDSYTKLVNNLFMLDKTKKDKKNVEPLGELIGQNIKRIRRTIFNWSQEKLAEVYGCNKTYIAQLELGIKVPGKSTRKKLAAALNCSPDDLIKPISPTDYARENTAQFEYFQSPVDTGIIAKVVENIENYLNKIKLRISPQRKGNLTAKLYEYAVTENCLPDDDIIKAYLPLS